MNGSELLPWVSGAAAATLLLAIASLLCACVATLHRRRALARFGHLTAVRGRVYGLGGQHGWSPYGRPALAYQLVWSLGLGMTTVFPIHTVPAVVLVDAKGDAFYVELANLSVLDARRATYTQSLGRYSLETTEGFLPPEDEVEVIGVLRAEVGPPVYDGYRMVPSVTKILSSRGGDLAITKNGRQSLLEPAPDPKHLLGLAALAASVFLTTSLATGMLVLFGARL